MKKLNNSDILIYQRPANKFSIIGWSFSLIISYLDSFRVSFRANGTQLEKVSDTAFEGVVLNGINHVNGFKNRFEYQGKEFLDKL